MTTTQILDQLFEKPMEPLFVPRYGKVIDLPDDYFNENYRSLSFVVKKHIEIQSLERIKIETDFEKPDISFTKGLGMEDGFSLFNTSHQQISGKLINILMDYDEKRFTATAAWLKDKINPFLFQYVLSVTVLHREDTKYYVPPLIFHQFPEQFVDSTIFYRIRQEKILVPETHKRNIKIPINFTASDREVEQRLAYFREDICVNIHHWHWHLVYPAEGKHKIVNKNRRGELFYYMHNQILARYNVDRFANHLRRTIPFNNFRETINEGYYPKIMRSQLNRAYPPRTSNSTIKDVDRENENILISDLERWRDRILGAIDQGFLQKSDGTTIQLTEDEGIDLLGNVIEASDISTNRQYYGNLHNLGHDAIAYIHDPDHRHLEDYGVMGDVSTAMRDPIFYRWHTFIDSLFLRYKNTLTPYTVKDLQNPGITVKSVKLQITSENESKIFNPNELVTFWETSEIEMAISLDFRENEKKKKEKIFVEYTHLQHEPFKYEIEVMNDNQSDSESTIRIFLLPKVDERGKILPFRDQRLLAIEMDKFTYTLKPKNNIITRHSSDSSVTVPLHQSLVKGGRRPSETEVDERVEFDFCGCGWPQHMLVPKGHQNAKGQKFDLFVMVTEGDIVEQNSGSNPNDKCKNSASFCGLRDRDYPDTRAMGYPFDRVRPTVLDKIDRLDKFEAIAENMKSVEIKIFHRPT